MSAALAHPPPIAALADPGWATRRNHADALATLRAAPASDIAPVRRRAPPPGGEGPLYRLPLAGHVVADRDGATIVAAPGTDVVAPAAGRVAYAGPFRRYGAVMIVDHGHGWTSVLTGLARVDAQAGEVLRGGDAIGVAGATLHLQLLHRGRPVDVARMAAWFGD